ncbi:MAG TPA: hypothetical protein VFE35_04445 [Candidatus Cybelea sp.]|jgi:hypothetical protein|nr:hypothetical protein [Candidatus Cybelea sp.]
MLKRLAIAVVLLGMIGAGTFPALAQQTAQPAPTLVPGPNLVPPPDSTLSARFSSFFTDILAGRVPSKNVSDQVRNGLTPQVLSQIRGSFANLGSYRHLDYVRADELQGYRRYHFSAVFDKGNQGVMFVVDSSNTVVGFFEDPNQ